MKRIIILSLTLMLNLLFILPVSGGTLNITGSTTVLPIAEKIAEIYMAQHPETHIIVSGGGSGNGIKAIIDGSTDIGNASRFIKNKELGYANGKGVYPVPFRIAYDCIVPVVHPGNPIENLSITQLKEIYKGRIKNWNQVGGNNQPITVISRDTSSGTYEVWKHKVMNKEDVFPGVRLESSNEDVLKSVMRDINAIGYIGLGYLQDAVKAVRVNKIKGSEATTLNGTYPISRPLYMFTQGWPTGEILEFLNFVLEPGLGQVHVKNAGFVSLYNSSSVSASQKIEITRQAAPDGSEKKVDARETIILLQRYLNALKYDAGPVDGIKGEKTNNAMLAFQKKNNLPLEWEVSDTLMKELRAQYMKFRN